MLHRYQVLLSDWQKEYFQFICDKYDLSCSSAIRAHLGLAILYSVQLIHPEYKPDIEPETMRDLSKKAAKNELQDEEVHHWMSKVLLEARKATELRLGDDKAKKKK